jgi:hypothetical protein
MRNRIASLVVLVTAVMVFSSPAVAQVYYATSGSGFRSPAAKKAAAEAAAKPLPYDPRDVSGIWYIAPGNRRGGQIMGGTPAPAMTAWGQALYDARKPATGSPRAVPPAQANDPLGNCDPEGYPRSLGPGPVEFVQVPGKILQRFHFGERFREIYTDGRKLDTEDLDPRWYGWAVGHWDGNTLVVDSTGYDERAWLNDDGRPHSEGMKLHEVYSHPDALTLEVTMTLDDPKAYTKLWVGAKQTYKLELPKGLTVLYEWFCVPSEEESFNFGVRNPAGGDLAHSRPLQ